MFSSIQSLSLAATLLLCLSPLSTATCGETGDLVCYGVNGQGTSQNVDPDDVAYAAGYIRFLADNNGKNPVWNMPREFDCSEWKLPVSDGGTVLALSKHIVPKTNSSVSYYDIANTIDGGRNPTAAQRAASLLGACGKNGGQVKVRINSTDPAYSASNYKGTTAMPQDIIIKIVRDPDYKG